jgi:hypothetical protein
MPPIDKANEAHPLNEKDEKERLARIYVQLFNGIVDYGRDQKDLKASADEIGHHMASLRRAAQSLQLVAALDAPIALVRVALARYGDDCSFEDLLAYYSELSVIASECTKLADDFETAAVALYGRLRTTSGNQSTLPLRCMIFAAATSYWKLTGRDPGTSKGDFGPFGRFVLEIIDCIPIIDRPSEPSPTAVAEVVQAWKNNHAVHALRENREKPTEA